MKPARTYKDKGWKSMGDWLGTGTIASQQKEYRSFDEAKKFVHTLKLKSHTEWRAYCKDEMPNLPPKPDDIPMKPERTYKDKGWKGLGDWVGTGVIVPRLRKYRSFDEAKKFVHTLKLKSHTEWRAYCKDEMPNLPPKPDDIPMKPERKYKDQGWKSVGDWLGTGVIAPRLRKYRSYDEAKKFVQSLGLKTQTKWTAYCRGEMPDLPQKKPNDIPVKPERTYKDKGWEGWGDWLGGQER